MNESEKSIYALILSLNLANTLDTINCVFSSVLSTFYLKIHQNGVISFQHVGLILSENKR